MKSKLTLKQIEDFYRRKYLIDQTILNNLNQAVIYGAKGINAQMPAHLRRATQDYDVYSQKARQKAFEIENKLDAVYGGDYFYVEKGTNKGTWRLKSHANKESYLDVTQQEKKKLPFKTINGKRYLTLQAIKEHTLNTLKNKSATHRQNKDQDILNRINIANKKRGGVSLW